MRSQCMLRPSEISFFSQIPTLFSAWQATTQAPQPVQRSRSITIPHLYGLVIFSIRSSRLLPLQNGMVLGALSSHMMREVVDQLPPFVPQFVQQVDAVVQTCFILFLILRFRSDEDDFIFPDHTSLLLTVRTF